MSKKKVYAIYKGDKFIDVGTIEELAERMRNKEGNSKIYDITCICKKK